MKPSATATGIIAALAISATAAIALPLVNIFKSMEESELMVVRGSVTALLVAIIIAVRIRNRRKYNAIQKRPEDRLPLAPLYKLSWRILAFSIIFSMATLSLYAGIRAWGTSPTLVVLTTTPIVNIAAKILRRQQVNRRVYLCLTGLLLGVTIALNPWEASFDMKGFLLSIAATLLGGIGFEVLSGAKGIDPYNKSFWLAVVTAALGSGVTLHGGHLPLAQEAWSFSHAIALIGFGITGGFAYYLANIVAFEKLRTEVASTLAMAETPAVIVGAWLVLEEKLALIQWIGVGIALTATATLSATEAKSDP